MRFEFGDVILVPFPFTSHTAPKKRPAILASNRTYNAVRPDVVVMAVTSQLRPSATSGEVWIDRPPCCRSADRDASSLAIVFAELFYEIPTRAIWTLLDRFIFFPERQFRLS
jgi:hypothetical protein